MKKIFTTMAALALVAMFVSSAQAAQAKVASGFVGFTTTTIDGAQGMLQMHALCQSDYGAPARMATSIEYWLSPNAQAPIGNDAWLHPIQDGVGGDFSGFPRAGSCNGWTGPTSDSGLVVLTTGKPFQRICTVQNVVACYVP